MSVRYPLLISLTLLLGCPTPTPTTNPTGGPTDETRTDPPGTDENTTTSDTSTTEAQEAASDNDSLDDPLFYESFLGSGALRTFTVSDDVSTAPGDVEDWVGFTTPAPDNDGVNITFELACAGTETIVMQLWDDDVASPAALGATYTLNCAVGEKTLRLKTNHDYLARIHYPQGAEAGDYTVWTLTVSW